MPPRPSQSDSWPDPFPVTYQDINDLAGSQPEFNPAPLRFETIRRIEKATGRPLVCYVAQTHGIMPGAPVAIDDGDLVGFGDLVRGLAAESAVDVLIVSNGGAAEAAERLVGLLRDAFDSVRFLVPGNAYSAATLICLSGDEVVMGPLATLGPIDPQINGIPARAVLRGFESVEERLKTEGPDALTAYMPLLAKYDLHILEICKSAAALSMELARSWLSTYMLKTDVDSEKVTELVEFFSDYDHHKSHGRSISRKTARDKGLNVLLSEDSEPGLDDLMTSLYNQYELFLEKSPFVKLFENSRGVNWGRQFQSVPMQIPFGAIAQPPGEPKRSGAT